MLRSLDGGARVDADGQRVDAFIQRHIQHIFTRLARHIVDNGGGGGELLAGACAVHKGPGAIVL